MQRAVEVLLFSLQNIRKLEIAITAVLCMTYPYHSLELQMTCVCVPNLYSVFR